MALGIGLGLNFGMGEGLRLPAPTVSAITPSSGPAAGSTSVTNLAGTGFVSGATVTIGGTPATGVAFVSATKLTCTTPAGSAGAQDVVVTNPDSQTSGSTGAGLFTYIAAPALSSLNYAQGDVIGGGTSIIITGTNLSNASGVSFGGTAATITGNTSTTVTVALPAKSAGATTVTVTTPGGTSGTLAFEFWAPSTPSGCTLFCEQPDYSDLAGTSTWTARTGSSIVTVGSEPAASSGHPVFDGASRLSSGTTGTLMTMSGTCAGTFACVVSTSAVVSPSGTPISDAGLWGDDTRGAIGAALTSNGFTSIAKDSAYQHVDVALSADSSPHLGIMRFLDSDKLGAKVDGSAWTETAFGSHNADATKTVVIGKNYASAFINHAFMRAVVFYNVKLSDANATKLYKWAQQRHGVT